VNRSASPFATRLGAITDRLQESLFTIPAVVILVAVVVAQVFVVVDRRLDDALDSLPLLEVTVASSRAILSTIAAATITVAAIVFSMTAVTVQLASSQYSPRILAGFLRDRLQQVVIGVVIGTFVFCLLVLANVKSTGDAAAEAVARTSLAVSSGLVLGVVSMLAIVAFIDHIMARIRIDDIIRRIARETQGHVRRNHPERGSAPPRELGASRTTSDSSGRVRSERSGWLQRFDAASLLAMLPPDGVARLDVRIGQHVAEGDQLLTVWPAPDEGAPLRSGQARYMTVGRSRSIEQDVSFGLRQLVDIALRALSPGINDPGTAEDVIQHLAGPLREILHRDLPTRVVDGEGGRRVYLPEAPGYGDYVHTSFREIRLAAAGQPRVLATMLEVLADLATDLEEHDLSGRAAALYEEARLTVRAALESDLPREDLGALEGPAGRLGLLEELEPPGDAPSDPEQRPQEG
jgi:uncharacterized membrane protein